MRKGFIGLAIAATVFAAVAVTFPLERLVFRMPNSSAGPDGQTLAEALGYPRKARLLVVNSDDTAAHPSFTDGAADVMAFGIVTSTSVIVHDRNDRELRRMADLAQENPAWGVGIHLMLTNEYQNDYPWAPVLSQTEVPSLYNESGLAWEKISEVEVQANPAEVSREFRAQIQKALDSGINLTHIDSHMGTYYRNSRYPGAPANSLRQAAIALAIEFDLPITMNTFDPAAEADMAYLDKVGILRPDTFFGFYELEDINRSLGYEPGNIAGWVRAAIANAIFGLEVPYENQASHQADLPLRLELYLHALAGVTRPGLNHVFMHAAREHGPANATIPAGRNHAPGRDQTVRLGDTAVFSNPAVRDHMAKHSLHLVNYADVLAVQRQWRKQRLETPSRLGSSATD